jgi:hypothetical protein
MNKMAQEGGMNWVLIGIILAIVVLAVLVWIFRDQISLIVANMMHLTPSNESVQNLSKCINNPGLPECNV